MSHVVCIGVDRTLEQFRLHEAASAMRMARCAAMVSPISIFEAGWHVQFGAGPSGVGSDGADHFPQGFALSGGVVPLGPRLMLEPAGWADDGHSDVGQAGQIARQLAAARPGPLLVPREVADMVDRFSISQWPWFRASISVGSAPSEVSPYTVSTVVIFFFRTVR